uniref:Uncharacterized protein n=1 Tax=viral metagenome TaxID=1070528 RepID=A0A6C0KUX8_9ZZZZ
MSKHKHVSDDLKLRAVQHYLKSKRSNNQLNTDKLISMYPNIPNIHDAVKNILSIYKKDKNRVCGRY